MPDNPALSEFITDLIVTEYRTATDLAEAIGMSLSAFSRAAGQEGTFSEANCLKLAALTGERLDMVLQKAGRPQDVIDAAVEVYGGDETFSRQEKRLVKLWRDISRKKQAAFLALLKKD